MGCDYLCVDHCGVVVADGAVIGFSGTEESLYRRQRQMCIPDRSAPAPAAAAAPAAAGGGSAAAPSAPSAPSAPAAAAPALAAVQGSSAPAASGGSGSSASSSSLTVEPVEQVSATVTVVLDNVGSPQFLNGKGTWPDVMFHGFFGFQEPALGWEPTFDNQGNAIVNTDRACHAGYVATGWEMIVPKKGGGELTMEGKTLAELDQADLTDPDEQGTIRVHIREGIDFYRIVDGDMVNVGELTGEDFAWSFNDAGADNIESAHSNSFKRMNTIKSGHRLLSTLPKPPTGPS